MTTCKAEAPYAETIVYCRLPINHLTRWHEGHAEIPCVSCGGRDYHSFSYDCPELSERLGFPNNSNMFSSGTEVVRWEGPTTPMPAQFLAEAEAWGRELQRECD